MRKEIRIYGVSTVDYQKGMSDEEFMTIAESNGNVWSQEGFNRLNVVVGNMILKVFNV